MIVVVVGVWLVDEMVEQERRIGGMRLRGGGLLGCGGLAAAEVSKMNLTRMDEDVAFIYERPPRTNR